MYFFQTFNVLMFLPVDYEDFLILENIDHAELSEDVEGKPYHIHRAVENGREHFIRVRYCFG